MAWIYLLIAGIFEVVWATAMKLSNGFSNLPYAALTLVGMIISFAGPGNGYQAPAAQPRLPHLDRDWRGWFNHCWGGPLSRPVTGNHLGFRYPVNRCHHRH